MPSRKIFKRRGQALVLYALLLPLLFLFVGLGIDLGWYFINVSRLQNAADAAALAGAQALVKENEAFEDYYVVSLRSNNLPKDFDSYETLFTDKYKFGTLSKYPTNDETKNTLKSGRVEAEEYIRKNLSGAEFVDGESTERTALGATDGWSNSSSATAKKVSGSVELRYKLIDAKNNVLGPRYYVVKLTEKIRHLFMPGWFEPMEAPVMAAVLLQPHDEGLITPMEKLERTMVIDNWEYQNKFRGNTGFYAGNWNHYKSGTSSNKTGVSYTAGDAYRTETVNVASFIGNGKDNKRSTNGSDGQKTSANGNQFYSWDKVDSLNIDFQAEIQKAFTSDWDLGQAVSGQTYTHIDENNSWGKGNGDDKRILFNVEFNDVFPTRDESKQADPLWVRIESEPIKSLAYIGKPGHTNYNTVRQITLNFNKDNTTIAGDHYVNRPYVIFYTGPENIDYATDDNDVLIRHSQPVVINLNEDLNAILYMPNSPVIINGNKKDLHGFVIAKCYLKAVTREDMRGTGSITLYDGFNAPKPFDCGYAEGIDSSGNTLYVKPEKLLTSEGETNSVRSEHPNAEIETESNGDLTVSEEVQAPKYILLEYTKADSEKYEVIENGKHNENKTFAAYVTATYKEKFKAFSGLTDSQITAVKFPNENYKETTATYWVATSDLSDNAVDSTYVKVLVGDETKYVKKNKLPYVKVRTDKEYFYVCVYDLMLTTSGGKGVRMIDNSYTDEQLTSSYKKSGDVTTTVGDIYINDTAINKYGDSWALDRSWYDSSHNNWKKDKLDFYTKNGVTYFNLKSEVAALPKEPQVIATYRKIRLLDDDGNVLLDDDGNEVVKYFKEGTTYYTKVYNNATNHDNYIIVDENGNILTKPVTDPAVLDVVTEAQNNAVSTSSPYFTTYTRVPNSNEQPLDNKPNIIDGKYRGNDIRHQTRDYRIPALERVYSVTDSNEHKNVFNLSNDSYYSYFDIEELERVNYCYMNVDEINKKVKNPETGMWEKSNKWKVDDMFFTTVRAGWID